MWISCLRAQFAAILIEKMQIFALKNRVILVDRYLRISDRFLGVHNCFGRICARAAVAS